MIGHCGLKFLRHLAEESAGCCFLTIGLKNDLMRNRVLWKLKCSTTSKISIVMQHITKISSMIKTVLVNILEIVIGLSGGLAVGAGYVAVLMIGRASCREMD